MKNHSHPEKKKKEMDKFCSEELECEGQTVIR